MIFYLLVRLYVFRRWSSVTLITAGSGSDMNVKLPFIAEFCCKQSDPGTYGGFKMNLEIIREIESEQLKAEPPVFRVGDTVRVHNRITEGEKSRVQVFEGTVIKKQGGSSRATFTVRKNSYGVGVEKTYPIHSPNVEKVEVVRSGKARRAKLFFLRDRTGKRAKLKEIVD